MRYKTGMSFSLLLSTLYLLLWTLSSSMDVIVRMVGETSNYEQLVKCGVSVNGLENV